MGESESPAVCTHFDDFPRQETLSNCHRSESRTRARVFRASGGRRRDEKTVRLRPPPLAVSAGGSSAEFVGVARDTEVVTSAAVGAGHSRVLAVAGERAEGSRLAVCEGLLRGRELLAVAVEGGRAALCQLEPVAPIQMTVRRPQIAPPPSVSVPVAASRSLSLLASTPVSRSALVSMPRSVPTSMWTMRAPPTRRGPRSNRLTTSIRPPSPPPARRATPDRAIQWPGSRELAMIRPSGRQGARCAAGRADSLSCRFLVDERSCVLRWRHSCGL